MKFKTKVDCFHNGRYYEAGQEVECDCKFCKEGKVKYFEIIDDKKVSRETNVDDKKEFTEDVKIEIKDEKKKKNKIEIID